MQKDKPVDPKTRKELDAVYAIVAALDGMDTSNQERLLNTALALMGVELQVVGR